MLQSGVKKFVFWLKYTINPVWAKRICDLTCLKATFIRQNTFVIVPWEPTLKIPYKQAGYLYQIRPCFTIFKSASS